MLTANAPAHQPSTAQPIMSGTYPTVNASVEKLTLVLNPASFGIQINVNALVTAIMLLPVNQIKSGMMSLVHASVSKKNYPAPQEILVIFGAKKLANVSLSALMANA